MSNFRFGWNYIDTDIETHLDVPDNINARIGLEGFNQNLRGVSEMVMNPYQALGNNTFRPNLIQSQTRQISADNTLTRGNHAIKFGAQIFLLQSFIDQSAAHHGHDHLRRAASPRGRAAAARPATLLAICCWDCPGKSSVRTRCT